MIKNTRGGVKMELAIVLFSHCISVNYLDIFSRSWFCNNAAGSGSVQL